MVSYCCVKGCNNNSNTKKKDPGSMISFHAFPSNQELKTKWLRAIGRPNWVPPSHSRVCSAHFSYDQINYDGCRIRIKDDAFPVNSLPLNSNFEVSTLEVCRICLATDDKLYSLQDTKLGQCMDNIAGLGMRDIEGLPQYVCYQCAPYLIKCNKLIQKSMITQATLLEIFTKNGQITESLIKQQNRCQLNLQSPLCSRVLTDQYDYYMKFDHEINTKYFNENNSVFNISQNEKINFKNEDTDLKVPKCDLNDFEINSILNDYDDNSTHDSQEYNTCSPKVDVTSIDDGLKDKVIPTRQKKKKKLCGQKKLLRNRPSRKRSLDLTPTETEMQKYFDIVHLTLQEQIEEWEKNAKCTPINSKTVYQCEVCHRSFVNTNLYKLHIAVHDPRHGEAVCPVCKQRFKNTGLASSHAKRVHGKKFFCKTCPKVFNNVGVAKKHQRIHSGFLYICDACSFTSRHESALHVHRRSHHAADSCALCGTSVTNVRALQAHVRAKHNQLGTSGHATQVTTEFNCEQCNINFESDAARQVHLLTSCQHRIKPDSCNTTEDSNIDNSCRKCGIMCSTRSELVTHCRTEHPAYRRCHSYTATCHLCGETMSSRKKHWLHMRRQHPKDINTYQPVIAAVCDICGKGFQNSTKLRMHQLRHGPPSLRCSDCPRVCYDRPALIQHALSHRNDRPHCCRTCGKAFKLRTNLDRHYRVHSDVAPYECTICSKTFKYSSGVNLHIRTVHYKLPQPPRKKRNKPAKDTNDLIKI